MKLKDILENVDYKVLRGNCDAEITSVAYDSRKVVPGSLFVCIKGFKSDGHQYIGAAVENGAAAIVVTDENTAYPGDTVIKVEDDRKALALIAANWFGHPAKKLTLVGVTGTKGKTTVTHMLKSILNSAGYKVGMIGTLGAFIGDEKIPTGNTTPESYELHSLFARMLESGCTHAVMEVSSQALKLKRTAGITYDYGAFLNLSPDHISENEHKDFEEYLQCKKLLFSQTKKNIVNLDADHWFEITDGLDSYITVSRKTDADYTAKDIQNFWKDDFLGVRFTLSGRLDAEIHLNMPGEFNVENALIAIAVAHDMGIPTGAIKDGLKNVNVKGRTQLIKEASPFATFLIDYAHNALSMENLLGMLKSYNPGRLICLFGAGGGRDKKRRYDMGLIAGKYADCSILTTDNPRDESVEKINEEIIEGLDVHNGKYEIILDRREAIHYLIDHCKKGDIIALIGKGHEEYQEIKGVKYHFSEEEIIKEYLSTK